MGTQCPFPVHRIVHRVGAGLWMEQGILWTRATGLWIAPELSQIGRGFGRSALARSRAVA